MCKTTTSSRSQQEEEHRRQQKHLQKGVKHQKTKSIYPDHGTEDRIIRMLLARQSDIVSPPQSTSPARIDTIRPVPLTGESDIAPPFLRKPCVSNSHKVSSSTSLSDGVVSASGFDFYLQDRIHQTRLIRGEDKRRCIARPVTVRVVATARINEYLTTEGSVMHVLHNNPHPCFLGMVSTVEHNDRSFLVMDPVGADLMSYLNKRGRLSEPTAMSLFRQLVSAIAHCHNNRVVLHRLRVEHIFLPPKNCAPSNKHLKIADLGCARVESEAQLSSMVPSDIFALGSILVRMLTGCDLSHSDKPSRTHRLNMIESLSPQVIDLIDHLLNEDPSLRPTSTSLMAMLDDSDSHSPLPFLQCPTSPCPTTVHHTHPLSQPDQIVPTVNNITTSPSTSSSTSTSIRKRRASGDGEIQEHALHYQRDRTKTENQRSISIDHYERENRSPSPSLWDNEFFERCMSVLDDGLSSEYSPSVRTKKMRMTTPPYSDESDTDDDDNSDDSADEFEFEDSDLILHSDDDSDTIDSSDDEDWDSEEDEDDDDSAFDHLEL